MVVVNRNIWFKITISFQKYKKLSFVATSISYNVFGYKMLLLLFCSSRLKRVATFEEEDEKMLKMYYLLSEKSNFESIYVFDDVNKENLPLYKTDVYPLGVFLSKIVEILDVFEKENYSFVLNKEYMIKGFKVFKTQEEQYSLSNEVNDDIPARMIFEILLTEDVELLAGKRDVKLISKLLRNCVDFIKQCQEKKEYLYPDLIKLFIKTYYPMIPHHYEYLSETFHHNFDVNVNAEAVKESLDNNYSKEIRISSSKRKSRPLFSLDTNEKCNQNNETNDRVLITPLMVYEIHDIVDLILATLKSILEQNLFIKKCSECQKLFITPKWNVEYCPQPYNAEISCRRYAKGERIKHTEYRSLHKSKSNVIRRKFGERSPEYTKYMRLHQIEYEKLERGEISAEDLANWIKKYKHLKMIR